MIKSKQKEVIRLKRSDIEELGEKYSKALKKVMKRKTFAQEVSDSLKDFKKLPPWEKEKLARVVPPKEKSYKRRGVK
ncbi:MAG: hypothetical protein Q7R64_03915 [bacterium]|nr:hypothetical protein [bacterium]